MRTITEGADMDKLDLILVGVIACLVLLAFHIF
jgi:hypothetical protein